jgi:DNA-binding CsgD family transcriptional regulator/tetratricopeptide (TPR) repeat protein
MSAGVEDLVERESELERLGTWLDEARYGRGGLLVIEGEAGIGKTALVEVTVASARAGGMRVLAARGSELERGFGFGVVRQALERAVASREELFAGRAALAASVLGRPHEAAGVAATEGALHGLYWLCAALADTEPLLLAVDDAHWADEESVAFLRFLALRLDGTRIAALVATRPPPADGPLAGLLADPEVHALRPRALGQEGVAWMLAQRLGREPEPSFAAACHRATGGNAFLVDQLATALLAEHIEPTAARAPQVAELRTDPLARTILARLDSDARALARAVAILGDEVRVQVAAELARQTPGTAEPAADALAAAGVLRDERPLGFRHPLLRGAVLAGMPAGERTEAHAAAARLLRTRGAPAERVAAHLLQLDPLGDPDAAVTMREAAREASSRGAPASAVALLQRALQEPLERGERAEGLMALGTAEQSLGQSTASEHFVQAALVAADPGPRVAAAIAAGHAAVLDPVGGAQALELLDAIDIRDDDRELAVRVLNARLAAAWGDIGHFHAIADEAEALSPLTGATPAECQLLAHLARVRLEAGGNAAEVAELAERAADPDALEAVQWFVTIIVALTSADRYDAADRVARGAIDRARERGALSAYHMAMTWRARIARLHGDLEEAESLAHAALEAGESMRDWWRLAPASVLIETLVDQGRVADACGVWVATGLGEAVPHQRPLTPQHHARARLRLAAGDPDAALADLAEDRRRLGRAATNSVTALATRLRSAEALHALGRADEARDASCAALEVARRFGAASSIGAALRVHGVLTGDEDSLREAVNRLRDAPARLERARALIDLGAALRRRGARRDSRDPLRAGHDLAVQCGARGLAEHARNELGASGVHVARRDPDRRDDLTPSELRIARLAAKGASNKEIAQSLFLTVKTVEMHLSNSYRKLDIRSRRDLPIALARAADNPEH